MPNPTRKRPTEKHTAAGRRLIRSVKQAIAWASGEDVPVRVTMVSVERVPVVDVRSVRQKLGLSQARFAARFGFTAATVRNWEQGRTQPDGPARVLLAVIAHHPDAVDDALRKASRSRPSRIRSAPLRRMT
jgi:putative transcriptional regulator